MAQDAVSAARNDPAFQQALTLWLQGDESASLPALAGLALGGNSAARLLLGHIDKTPALQGPWLTLLPRSERVTLLRAQGGLSGQNWITLDADQSDVARLWTALWQGSENLDIAQSFANNGDARAVTQALLAVASRQQRPFPAQVVMQDWFPQGLVHLGDGWGPTAPALAHLHLGDPQGDMVGETPDPSDRADWLATAPEAAALRALCATRCPDTAAACAQALLGAFTVYQSLLVHGSPDATLIDNDTFTRSAKGQATLARRLMLGRAARLRQPHLAKVEAADTCAADWLRSEFARYDVPVPPAPKAPE